MTWPQERKVMSSENGLLVCLRSIIQTPDGKCRLWDVQFQFHIHTSDFDWKCPLGTQLLVTLSFAIDNYKSLNIILFKCLSGCTYNAHCGSDGKWSGDQKSILIFFHNWSKLESSDVQVQNYDSLPTCSTQTFQDLSKRSFF